MNLRPQLRSQIQASESTQRCDKVFFLPLFSRNFAIQLSSNFHRFVILCICWDTPSEKTGLWQLPKVSSVSNVSTIQFAWTKIKNHFCLLIFSKENNVTSWNIVPSIVFCPVNHILSVRWIWHNWPKKRKRNCPIAYIHTGYICRHNRFNLFLECLAYEVTLSLCFTMLVAFC